MSESKREAAHTPGPWFVGAQNDALYILDRRPAHDNDYPDHEADVGCIAKVYDDIRDAEIGRANAALIARAPDLAAEVEALRAERDEAVNALPQAIRAERRKVEALQHALRLSIIGMREAAALLNETRTPALALAHGLSAALAASQKGGE